MGECLSQEEGGWSVVEYHYEVLVIHDATDNRVCFMATPGDLSRWPQIQARAHLIAASPTLLEALQVIADGDGDPQEIARQTLEMTGLPQISG